MRFSTKVGLLLLLLTALFSMEVVAQTVTGRYEQKKLGAVLKDIEQQSGLSVIYRKGELDEDKLVNASFNNTSVKDALESLLGESMKVTLSGKMITISKQDEPQKRNTGFTGRVIDTNGDPIPGAGVIMKGTGKGTVTDLDGVFSFDDLNDGA